MADNYVLLERIELNASAASVTISNIPQTGYTDLKVVFSIRTDNNSSNYLSAFITFNGSSTGYSQKMLYGTGSSALSASGSGSYLDWSAYGSTVAATASTFGNGEIYIPNYTGSTNKSVSSDSVSENNATNAITALTAGLWSNTAAITSITFTGNSGNLIAGSTFSLYGVAALGTTPAIAPKANGGNVIATDGTYWYHAFLSSGTFTPQTTLSADVLVVAGGGAAGYDWAAGGGAGGVFSATAQSLSSGTGYTCTIGAGGAGVAAEAVRGANGSNSTFGSLTAAIGGGGGGGLNYPSVAGTGGDGGSGGGGNQGYNYGGPKAGGSSTQTSTGGTGYGFAGGNGYSAGANTEGSGGGGGAGVAGTAGTSGVGGKGGNGTTAFSSWGLATVTGQNVGGTVYYAGGGGGAGRSSHGAGGYGGGGLGGIAATGADGTPNTGGGGGGDAHSGGSGIIIVRYLVA